MADWLCNADTWAHANLSAANTTFALLLAMCVLVNVTKSDIVAESRAMSTAWILFAGLAYCPPVAWGFWLLLGVGIAGFHLARGDRHRRVAGLCEWMIQSIVNLVVAAVWLPLSLLLWALTPARLYKSA
ncbi:hypothetical protein ACPPVW_18450 [Leifsonia sp. McL0607]|uniref:hypothetical protein n=1 Tax=Leifsonia sp. McL0607 TaxID=3415672 RepID=UPI003CE9AE1A